MASVHGIDYSQSYDIQSLKDGGVTFVCRYLGFTSSTLPQTKMITYSEAYDLLNAGIAIVSLWEWTADRAGLNNTFYNGSKVAAFNGGEADAAAAMIAHANISGPSDAPIYFAIDYATDGHDTLDYFRGILSVLGFSRVGAYGPPAALQYLLSQGMITYTWAWINPASVGSTLQPNIIQTATGVTLGKMTVDTDMAMTNTFGQWTHPQTDALPEPQWFQFPIVVPPCNTNFDVDLGGSHDLTIKPPPNMPVTSIVSGVVSDISTPTWGMQVCLKLDVPVQGHDYFGYLHLSAVNPAIHIGSHVAYGDLLGWVGGANSIDQYLGTTNPTGHSFINSSYMSSQVQAGIALHDGPAYGGIGWVNFPPVLESLDPTAILLAARTTGRGATPMPNYAMQQFEAVWKSTTFGVKWYKSGLYYARLAAFLDNKLGACTPTEDEQTTSVDGTLIITNWAGDPIRWQRYDDGSHGEWIISSGEGHIYDALGHGA